MAEDPDPCKVANFALDRGLLLCYKKNLVPVGIHHAFDCQRRTFRHLLVVAGKVVSLPTGGPF
jgi:hypothetical protein